LLFNAAIRIGGATTRLGAKTPDPDGMRDPVGMRRDNVTFPGSARYRFDHA
jgi:hypothetical protein